MKVLINITDEDISEGIRGDCRNCPVARAIKRVIPLGNFMEVDVMTLVYYNGNNVHMIDLPEAASFFIHNFDAIEEVKPFSFELEIPE